LCATTIGWFMRMQTFTPALVRPSSARCAISTGAPVRMKLMAWQVN